MSYFTSEETVSTVPPRGTRSGTSGAEPRWTARSAAGEEGRFFSCMLGPFKELPVGTRFEFRGLRYEKVARSMACDEERLGNVFHEDTEVVWSPPAPRAGNDAPPADGPADEI